MSDEVLRQFAESTHDDLGHLLTSATRAVNVAIMGALMGRGYADVKASHIPVFSGLRPGGTHISTMAKDAGISRQAMSSLVKEVVANGYVTTTADPKDARATLVSLTARGAEFCLSAIEVSASISAQYSKQVGADRMSELLDRLRTIAAE